jgi:hypothetical protein
MVPIKQSFETTYTTAIIATVKTTFIFTNITAFCSTFILSNLSISVRANNTTFSIPHYAT